MKRIFYSFFIALLVSLLDGCSQTKEDFLYSNSSLSSSSLKTVSSTTSTLSSTISPSSTSSTIDKNDPTTWPRFEFKELGFSLQMPFKKNKITVQYRENTNEEDRDHLGKSMYSFFASLQDTREEYTFLGAVSVYYNRGAEFSPYMINKLRSKGSSRYEVIGPAKFSYTIDPIKIIRQGALEFIFFDMKKDYYEKKKYDPYIKDWLKDHPEPYYGVTFNLPFNKHFKAVVFEFSTKDISFEELQKVFTTLVLSK